MTNFPKIGLALGGGAARGWAHIGVINALQEYNIRPDIICGTSIGALVGAACATGHLDELESWVSGLRRRDVAGFLDFSFNGGMIEGERLMKFFADQLGQNNTIEHLPMPYAAVATDLATGNEVWLQKGDLLQAVRASIALPGLFTPVYHEQRWLVDGGLVNPVPVSLCRAMGADIVIAVNLNKRLVGRSFREKEQADEQDSHNGFQAGVKTVKGWIGEVMERFGADNKEQLNEPGLFDVLSNSVSIMQDRLTRSRMAGDPPDITFSPDLSHINLMDFDHASEAIERGSQCVERNITQLDNILHDG